MLLMIDNDRPDARGRPGPTLYECDLGDCLARGGVWACRGGSGLER